LVPYECHLQLLPLREPTSWSRYHSLRLSREVETDILES
jgi:hypothetical protein